MDTDEEQSIFEGLEERKKLRAWRVLRAVSITVLFAIALTFCVLWGYSFYANVHVQEMQEVFGYETANFRIASFVTLLVTALLTICAGLFLVVKRNFRAALTVLFFGDVITWLMFLYF